MNNILTKVLLYGFQQQQDNSRQQQRGRQPFWRGNNTIAHGCRVQFHKVILRYIRSTKSPEYYEALYSLHYRG